MHIPTPPGIRQWPGEAVPGNNSPQNSHQAEAVADPARTIAHPGGVLPITCQTSCIMLDHCKSRGCLKSRNEAMRIEREMQGRRRGGRTAGRAS